MKLLSVIPFIFGLISATPALALDRLQMLAQENPQATPFEILKKLYDESVVPADVTDFDSSNMKDSTQHCWLAGIGTERKDLYKTSVVQFMEEVAAIPAEGPLFPATPAKVVDRNCLLVIVSGEMCKSIKTVKTNTDLVNTIPGSVNWSPAVHSFRKNGSLIAFKSVIVAEPKKPVTYYGYCYR